LAPAAPGRGALNTINCPMGSPADTSTHDRGGDVVTMDKIVALCKRRGFIFPSSEIYGGIGNTYDYGHYGVLLKNNVKGEWWRAMLQERDDIVAIDSAIIQHPRVWEASGHLEGFTDPLVDCRTCGQRFRADHLQELACGRKPSLHPGEAAECSLTEARDFNLMFETTIGPVKDSAAIAYLRPETAQGIFINFKNVLQFSRKKPPFGIAQIGKSFRNEITPGNFIFRTREFEQMEMEFFVPPADAGRWFEHWLAERERWYAELGLRRDHLRLRAHETDELSHYSSATSDVEYLFPPTGGKGEARWMELEGIANRGDFDLTRHAEFSGEKLEYFDQGSGERYVPHVIEPAAGADRAVLAFLADAYDEELVEREGTGEGERRTVLRLHPRLAPVKAAVLPLVGKDGQPELAHEVHRTLRERVVSEYDAGGAIGRRYRRQDEIGTPFCLTIDHQSLEDRTVTLRDRDSLAQERVAIADVADEIERRVLTPWHTPK
jgi:glycyl-tRNA synthetase